MARCRRFKENDKNAKRSLGECERTPEDTLRGPSRARRAAPGRRAGKPSAPKGRAEGQLALSARPQDTGASYAANRNLSSRQGRSNCPKVRTTLTQNETPFQNGEFPVTEGFPVQAG